MALHTQSFSHIWLFETLDCSPPGSSVHGISHARILKWVAISSARGSSWPRDDCWLEGVVTGPLQVLGSGVVSDFLKWPCVPYIWQKFLIYFDQFMIPFLRYFLILKVGLVVLTEIWGWRRLNLLELNKVQFQPHWMRQDGKEWYTVMRLVVLMIIMLLSTFSKAFSYMLFHLIFITDLNRKSSNDYLYSANS